MYGGLNTMCAAKLHIYCRATACFFIYFSGRSRQKWRPISQKAAFSNPSVPTAHSQPRIFSSMGAQNRHASSPFPRTYTTRGENSAIPPKKRTIFRRPHFCSPTDGRARHAPTHRPFFLSTKSATLQVCSVALSFKWLSCAPMDSARREEIFGMGSWFDRLLSVHHIHSGRQMFPCSAHTLAL